MRYSQFIKVDDRFQSSVNLQFDLNKLNKINSYIPTEHSVEILDRYLRAVYYDSTDRATVLIGPYGRGKSHLILTLLAILSLKEIDADEKTGLNAKGTLDKLCERINAVNPETASLAKELKLSSKPMLPVIINSNYGDINQAFLMAIKEALQREALSDLMPDTYFEAALAMIEKWEVNFPDALEKLKEELSKSKTNIGELKTELKKCSSDAYLLFKNCYPAVASGTEFNPMTNTDVIKLYTSINLVLCEQHNYRGMMIVFDEFSKFLETNVEKKKSLDLKLIQDMAELATRSGKNQIHFICITHKGILDYSATDSFRAVEGRFSDVRFVNSSEQNYELIANAILKDKAEFAKFKEANKAAFEKIKIKSYSTGIFNDLDSDIYDDVLLYGCYPLAPFSSYTLLRVSEKVAQNERTMFTFLSKNEAHTLSKFIDMEHNGADFLTVDWIYDYFEELFKKEVFNKSVHSIWSKSVAAIKQATDENQIKIIKAIAVIGIIGDDKLKPISSHIKACLDLTDAEFDSAIEVLLRNHIIHRRGTDSHYIFLTANGVDVRKYINEVMETKAIRINRCAVLSQIVDLGNVLPRRYNDEYDMLRYFKCIFMEADAFLSIRNEEQLKNEYGCDGLIIYIVSDNKTLKLKIEEKVRTFTNDKQIIVCLVDDAFEKTDALREYFSIQDLKNNPEYSKDEKFMQELQVYEEDCAKSIIQYINKTYSPQNLKCNYYNSEGILPDITKQVHLNRAVSNICLERYQYTPKINNEMINKKNLSAPIKKARILIMKALFESAESNTIKAVEGYGPESSIYRATIRNKGLETQENSNDEGLNRILAEIRRFILDSESKKKCFENLYQILLDKPFGMRKGPIPIYIAYVLRHYLDNVIIYYTDKEVPLTPELLDRINDDPGKYYMLLEKGTKAKTKYLSDIEAAFANHGRSNDSGLNQINKAASCMKNWVKSLPKYSRDFTINHIVSSADKLDPTIISLRRELLKFDTNPRELLFETIPEKIFEQKDLNTCVKKIVEIKKFLDEYLFEFKKYLIVKTKTVFAADYKGELGQALKNWYESLEQKTRHHIFDMSTNVFISYVFGLTNYDEMAIVSDLAKQMTGLSVEDWNDTTFEYYMASLNKVVDVITEFEANKDCRTSSDTYKITVTIDGEDVERTFTNKQLSAMGEMALNNIASVFYDFNESIDNDEKMAILLKLMKDLIGK